MASKKGKEKEHCHSPTVNSVGDTLNHCAGRSPSKQVAASATSLLSSLIRPTAEEACRLLQVEGQSSKSQAFRSSTTTSSFYWAEGTSLSRQSGYSFTGGTSVGFNEPQTTPESSIDKDFQNFVRGTSHPLLGTQNCEDMPTLPVVQSHPEDITQVLSSSPLTSAIWDEESGDSASRTSLTIKPNLQSAQVVEFISTGDVVEFLSREDAIYTEEVWGDMAQLYEAQEETGDSRDNGKDKKQDLANDALAGLQMLRGQFRSKL